GPGILTADGSLDRKALGAIAFADEEARARLNQIVHPQVGAEFARRLADAIAAKVELVVLDIPLLFEGRDSGRGSAAARNVQTTASGEPARSIRSTSALPTTTPSANDAIRAACSGVDTPNPTHTGTSETARTARTSRSRVSEIACRATVVPVSDTK